MKLKFLLAALFAFYCLKVFSQDNTGVSLGIGFPELAHAGIRYELWNTKLGLSFGTAFSGAYAVSGDLYYHFAGQSKYGKTPPWYLRANLTYWQFGKFLLVDLGQAAGLGIRAGREITVTDKMNVGLDAGIIPLSFFSGKRIPFSFIPSAGFRVNYRIGNIFSR